LRPKCETFSHSAVLASNYTLVVPEVRDFNDKTFGDCRNVFYTDALCVAKLAVSRQPRTQYCN